MKARRLTRMLLLVFVLMLSMGAPAQQQAAPVAPLDQPGHIFTVTMLKIEPSRVSEFLDFWQKEFVPLEKNIPEILSSKILQHRWGPSDTWYSSFMNTRTWQALKKPKGSRKGPFSALPPQIHRQPRLSKSSRPLFPDMWITFCLLLTAFASMARRNKCFSSYAFGFRT